MQLKITTDYAVRTIICLAQTKRVTTATEISEAMKIPRGYLINIIRDIGKGGFIKTFTGSKGGYALAKAPEDITLFDIIEEMEGLRINRCLEKDDYCSLGAKDYCAVHAVYGEIHQDIVLKLKSHTVASLIADRYE